jgi:hypothetical protein
LKGIYLSERQNAKIIDIICRAQKYADRTDIQSGLYPILIYPFSHQIEGMAMSKRLHYSDFEQEAL